jgi:hypothetical protein
MPGTDISKKFGQVVGLRDENVSRKYRNIPESHVTSHCVFLHGTESDHGQEGVSCNTVVLEPTDARKKFRNFNITFPRISLVVPMKIF